MNGITEAELNSLITQRRQISGENYAVARKAVLEHLKSIGRITPEQYERLKNSSGGH